MTPLVARLLTERGITDPVSFIDPSYEQRHDPFLLPDMERAVARILRAIENKERIAVWHDYDCDGIPGGSLLADFFMKIGYPVRMMVAERSEGYGLHEHGIDALAAEGVSVLITVDCGITEHEHIARAHARGIDVIVTDHHLPRSTSASRDGDLRDDLPPAIAVVNPHRRDSAYPEKVLCGTGVAFKLVEALLQKGTFAVSTGWEKWLLDLVALATVADMVPLTGENRVLVKYGLQVMAKGRRKGLAALFRKERIPLSCITEDDIAFSIAPKINAASRMESPRIGVELLTTTDEARAHALAHKLVSLNKARRLEGARVAKEVKRRLEGLPQVRELIVMGSQEWRPSLLGIAGNNIIETYKKTVCLWGKDGELIKGSIRSAGDVHVVELMTHARDIFIEFGGHESSGGFSIAPEKIFELEQALLDAYRALRAGASDESSVTLRSIQTSRDASAHDGTLSLREVTDRTYESLRLLAPFGIENEKPVFRFTDVIVSAFARFGAHQEHARLTLRDTTGATAEAISFFVARTSFTDALDLLSPGDRVTVEASIEKSHFMGRTSLRLRIESLSVPR